MPKKFKRISDIYPPKKFERILPERVTGRQKSQFKSLIFLLFLLIFCGSFFYFKLPKAEISIWPETETLNFKEKVSCQTKIFQPDFLTKIIPARIFETEETESQEFPSSGKFLKEEKAKGVIRVFNAYSTSPQVLVQNTRFISAEGKLFRSLERVTIPGGKYEGGKLVPGYLDIKVIAAETGEDYNIGPSTFSIPGFAGTQRYTAIYGKSFSPIEGGFKGEVFQVTKEDIDRAQNFLVEKLFTRAEDSLRNKIGEQFVLLEMAKKKEILETKPSVEAGTETQFFNFQAKVELKAISFKKSDLENFSREFVLSQVSQDKEIQKESLKINFAPELIDIDSEKIVLNLEFSAKVFRKIDNSKLKEALKDKSLEEIKIILAGEEGIKKTEIRFWPFWVERAPEKIEIKLNID